MNPDNAAEMMTNPDGTLSMSDDELINPVDSDTGDATPGGNESKSIFDRLLNTEPDIPLSQVESPWNPEIGGESRIYRGVQKIGGFDGVPAALDIGIGVLELLQSQQSQEADEQSQESTDEQSDSPIEGVDLEVSGV